MRPAPLSLSFPFSGMLCHLLSVSCAVIGFINFAHVQGVDGQFDGPEEDTSSLDGDRALPSSRMPAQVEGNPTPLSTSTTVPEHKGEVSLHLLTSHVQSRFAQHRTFISYSCRMLSAPKNLKLSSHLVKN